MGLYDRDYGRDEQTPWEQSQASPHSITVILIGINVAVYLLNTLSPMGDIERRSVMAEYGAVYGDTLYQPWKWWQFLSYGFVHDHHGIRHILWNMIGLFVFGRDVERKLGRAEFLRFYLLSVIAGGLVGSLTHLATANGGTVGASGAVIATAILFACYFPNRELLLMLVLPVKAWVLAVFFVVSDLAGAFGILQMGAGNTAFTVHLAGAVFALGYFFLNWNFSWLGALSEIPDRIRQRSRRMKLKIHDPDKKLQQEEAEADRILGKIHESGEDSLTSAERKILERYSRRQRQKRDQ